MTVQELIDLLKTFPLDTPILAYDGMEDYSPLETEGVKLTTHEDWPSGGNDPLTGFMRYVREERPCVKIIGG